MSNINFILVLNLWNKTSTSFKFAQFQNRYESEDFFDISHILSHEQTLEEFLEFDFFGDVQATMEAQDEGSSSSHSRRRSERLGKKSSRYFEFEDEEKGEKKKSLKRKSCEKSDKSKVRQIVSDDLSERRSSSEESDSSRVMVPTSKSLLRWY